MTVIRECSPSGNCRQHVGGLGMAEHQNFARPGDDILVNNAAFQNVVDDIQQFSTEDWDRAFKTNIYAMFFLSKAALRVLPPGGTIINTTSIQAYQPSGGLLHYASTKGAIVTFTKALSELAIKQGVRVNAVAPGPIWTPLIVATPPPISGRSPTATPRV